ncbi:GIY-YIG nuclease family protein [Xanthomonas sacchari]|uniref:GIY-YIG nuclease family protein n=1 Tax=Xanthomonas sacchari TaxID=56458 RepID=UPI0020C356F6|nr:GIY-YIG nuclease family protein [Xanthomonas sacchari]
MAADSPWFLYLLECRNGSYYAGITPDLQARFQAHLRGAGAKYTRANPPVRLLASRAYPDRAAASRAEYALKRLPRGCKLAFLAAPDPVPGADNLHAPAESAAVV